MMGDLTDAKGRFVNFKNTVIVMTSNVGSDIIYKMQEYRLSRKEKTQEMVLREEEMKEIVMHSLREKFKPEFLNRVDEITIFHPLGAEQIKQIVELQLGLVRKRLAEKNIRLEISPEVEYFLPKQVLIPFSGRDP